jgi:hypothetical protein
MSFVQLPVGDGNVIYVNPDTVRVIWPAGHDSTNLYFDDSHVVRVTEEPSSVARTLGQAG